MKKIAKNNKWESSEYTERVRIKPDKAEYLDATKGKLTRAGRLDKILEDYKRKEVQQ